MARLTLTQQLDLKVNKQEVARLTAVADDYATDPHADARQLKVAADLYVICALDQHAALCRKAIAALT